MKTAFKQVEKDFTAPEVEEMAPGGDPDLEEDDPLKEDANFKKIKAFLNHDRHADKAFCVMFSRTGELIVVHDRWGSCYAWQLLRTKRCHAWKENVKTAALLSTGREDYAAKLSIRMAI